MRYQTFLVAAVLLAIWITAPASARAGCPSASDLDPGIRLTRHKQYFSSVYTRQTEYVVRERRTSKQGQTTQKTSTRWIMGILASMRLSKNEVLEQQYDAYLDSKFFDAKGEVWTSRTIFRKNGAKIAEGVTRLENFGETYIDIGECRYDVVEVLSTVEASGSKSRNYTYFYSKDLGFVLGTLVGDKDRNAISSVFYDEIAVESAH